MASAVSSWPPPTDMAEVVDKRPKKSVVIGKDGGTPEQFEYYVHYIDCTWLAGIVVYPLGCLGVGWLTWRCGACVGADNRRLDEWISYDRVGSLPVEPALAADCDTEPLAVRHECTLLSLWK